MTLPYAPDPVPTIPIDVSHRDGTSDTGAPVRPWDARDVYKIGVSAELAALPGEQTAAMAAWVRPSRLTEAASASRMSHSLRRSLPSIPSRVMTPGRIWS